MHIKTHHAVCTVGQMVLLCWFFSAFAVETPAFNYVPPNGVVPDSATAVRIAEAVLLPIYGEEVLKRERPLKAVLHEGVWTVEGTLPEEVMGGVAEIDISKTNGSILRISHGQ